MKKEIAEKWVEALRSGKYKQGKASLCEVQGKTAKYCCLGVLCDILKSPYRKISVYKGYGDETGFETGFLPDAIMAESGMQTFYGKLGASSLTVLNDAGNSFGYIADIIEDNWEIL